MFPNPKHYHPSSSHTLNACPLRSFILLTVDPTTNLVLQVDSIAHTLFLCSPLGQNIHSLLTPLTPTLYRVGDLYVQACVHTSVTGEILYLLRDVTRLHLLSALAANKGGTVVMGITRFGVVDLVYPVGEKTDMVNSSVVAFVHPKDSRALVACLSEVYAKGFGAARVRWRVEGSEEIEEEEEDEEDEEDEEEEEEDEDEDEDEEINVQEEDLGRAGKEECWNSNGPLEKPTDNVLTPPPPGYAWIQVTTILSPPTSIDPHGTPICILRPLTPSRAFARLAFNAAFDTAYSFASSPFTLMRLPVQLITGPAELIARLWSELTHAAKLGVEYVKDNLQRLFELILETVNIVATVQWSQYPSLPAPVRTLVGVAARAGGMESRSRNRNRRYEVGDGCV